MWQGKCFQFLTVAILSFFSSLRGISQDFHLLKDINTDTDANPTNQNSLVYTSVSKGSAYAVLNGVTYFTTITSQEDQYGFWRTDGTEAGTWLIRADIAPAEIVVSNNKLFFAVNNALWVSDGTADGTHQVSSSLPIGQPNYSPTRITRFGSGVVFTISNRSTNDQLWKSDGTAAGTMLIKDLYRPSLQERGNFSSLMKEINGKFYFTVVYITGQINYATLWVSDGTEDNTYSLGSQFKGPSPVEEGLNGNIYFTALVPGDATVRKLCVTKGMQDDIAVVSGHNNLSLQSSIVYIPKNVQGVLYFIGNYGQTLLKYDERENAGIEVVHSVSADVAIDQPFSAGGMLYYDLYNKALNKHQLWRSTGVSGGNLLLKDSLQVFSLLEADGYLVFSGLEQANGDVELWKSDGTKAGTKKIMDINPGAPSSDPTHLTFTGSSIVFAANDGTHGRELWRSIGTEDGTVLIKDINTTSTGKGIYNPLFIRGTENVYFSAGAGKSARVWLTDGTSVGTRMVTNNIAHYGLNLENTDFMVVRKDSVCFFGKDSITEEGLFMVNHSSGAARLIKNFSGTGIFPQGFISMSDSLMYIICTNQNTLQFELWRSDFTLAGTYMVLDGTARPLSFARHKDILYVLKNNNSLYKTNGFKEATTLVKTFSGRLTVVTNYKDNIYVACIDGVDAGLWKVDSESMSTSLVSPLIITQPDALLVSGDNLFLTGYINGTSTLNTELYISNGTTAGTQKLTNPGANSSAPLMLAGKNGRVFFTKKINGVDKLFSSDGSKDGVIEISSVAPGIARPVERFAGIWNKALYFLTFDGVLWKSDGTPEGTGPIEDANLKDVRFDINRNDRLKVINDRLYVVGASAKYGREIFISRSTSVGGDSLLFCPPFAKTQLRAAVEGSSYQWQISDSSGSNFTNLLEGKLYKGVQTSRLQLDSLSSRYNHYHFRCVVDGVTQKPFVVVFRSQWSGAISSAWENPDNWDCGTLPDQYSDVVITKNGEVKIDSNVSIRSLSTKPGVTITITSGKQLIINGMPQ